jgi:uncharacterized protein (DUF58 family)
MRNKKFLKLAFFIPALAGLFLMASVPNTVTTVKSEGVSLANDEGVISVDKKTHDFGTIKESDGEIRATFTITNNTKSPVLIQKATASCGCTTPTWTKEPIAPGKTGTVVATYNPKNRGLGSFEKTVTITTTGNPETLIVRIKGIAE